MAKRTKQNNGKKNFEVFCYESDEGEICLEFGESAISFSKKRFLEFAHKLNEVRHGVLQKYLYQQKTNQIVINNSYRI